MLMEKLVSYKNHIRDQITFNSHAFRKYGWLVDEISSGDYEIEDKGNNLNVLCDKY